MVKTISLTAEVPPNREARIILPTDVPTGPAEFVVVVTSGSPATRTLGDLLRSEFFGMWKDRADIGDTLEYVRRLRIEAWSRAA